MLTILEKTVSPPQRFKKDFNTFKWSTFFMLDQLLGLSQKQKTAEGQTYKKLDYPGYAGKIYRKLYKRSIKKLHKQSGDVTYEQAIELPEITKDDFTREFFDKWKQDYNMPLVIRGYLADAPIMELTAEDNIISNFGDVEVLCTEIYSKKKESLSGQNMETIEVTLRDYLTSDKYENYYMNNFHGLLSNMDFYRLCKGKAIRKIQNRVCLLNQWFIKRGKNSRSSLHCANADNIFLNVQGKKEWHFIHPSYAPLLQTTLSKYGIYAISEAGDVNDVGDFFSIMCDKFEFFNKIPVYKILLEPGDILYNPPWWWHDVRNMTPYTIGCASRWAPSKGLDRQFYANSPTLFAGQMIEYIKNPKKSPYTMLRKAEKVDDVIKSIFSKSWDEKEKIKD